MIKKFFENILNLKSIVFLVMIAIVCFVISIGFSYNPVPLRFYEPQDNDLLETHYVDSSTITHSIQADDEGDLILNGEDCYFEIHDIENCGSTVAIFFKEPIPTTALSFSVTMDYGDGTGFHEDPAQEEVIYKVADKLSTCVCIEMNVDEYSAIRFRPNMNLSIDRIEIHENAPVEVIQNSPVNKKSILKGVILGLFATALIVLLEARFQIANAICDWVVQSKKYLLQDVAVFVISLGITSLLDKVLSGGQYSFAFYVYVVTAIVSAFVFVRYTMLGKLSVERTFLALVLLTGICMTLCCWPNKGWDSYLHYIETVQCTSLESEIKMTDADNYFAFLNDGTYPSDVYTEVIEHFNNTGSAATSWIMRIIKLNRIPAALAMSTVTLFGCDFYIKYIAGRLGQLLVYALCGYFGIRRLKSGKMIFALIYVLPLNMFQATNYSYDYWAFCFIMLGMAYFVGMCQEKDEELSIKDAIIMIAALDIGCSPKLKLIYAPVLIFPFLMSRSKIKNKKALYYTMCVIGLVVVMVLLYFASHNIISEGGDPRGDAPNPSAQIAFILENPKWYAVLLFNKMKVFLDPIINRSFNYFGYLDYCSGYVLLPYTLAVVTLTDKNESDKKAYPLLAKVYSLLYFFGEAAAVVTAMYIAFNAVGSDAIHGAQPRYLMPLIFPMCAMICGRGLNVKKYIPEKYYNAVVLGIAFAVNFVGIYQKMLPMTLY